MKRFWVGLILGLSLFAGTAQAAGPIRVNGAPVDASAAVYQDTTYVSLRAVCEALYPNSTITWEDGQAVARTPCGVLTARPGDDFLTLDGLRCPAAGPIRLEGGCTLAPIRTLAAILGGSVDWDPATGAIQVTGDDSRLYWLARIISAESQGEPLEGQIAVGNVVLNRAAHPDFPDTVYDVIFDSRWGGQFEPVRNGAIYEEPAEESVRAARLCLAGVNTAGDSLYFLSPALASNPWTMETRTLVTVIGTHWFYL